MIKISKTELSTLNEKIYRFRNGIEKSKHQDLNYFVTQLSGFQRQYKKAGLERSFAQNIFTFAESLRKMGIPDCPGIIYSYLMKMPFLKSNVKEFYARKALDYAYEKGDSIHILARLVDLEKLYLQTGQKHRRKNVLIAQEQELVRMCSNFREAKQNFRTFSRVNNKKQRYEMELAKTRVDIAKIIMKEEPQKAGRILMKARKTFVRTKRQKEVEFVDMMLSQLKTKNSS